jgi:spermidine/putrescine transport system ATP-binding protein
VDYSVELRQVTKRFADVTAVNNISLQVGAGEFFSLLGPSGCGKTTTLRMIAGFEEPTSGDILINSRNVSNKRPYERSVNTVFQNYALFPHLSVAGNIAFGLQRQKVPSPEITGRVDEALDLVRLKGMENRFPRQLSGGQQQRVALARALILHPEVLLLDEPLGALDLKLRKEMQIELKSLQEKVGITFIYVTHDQEEALTMSDRIAVMADGRLAQVGTPEEIYEFPKTGFVAEFIGESNFFSGAVTAVSGEKIEMKTSGGLKLMLRANAGLATGQRVKFSIRPEKFRVQPMDGDSELANRFVGEVTHKIYLGEVIDYIIALSASDQIKVYLKNKRTGDRPAVFAPGDKVLVSWHPDDCVILAE